MLKIMKYIKTKNPLRSLVVRISAALTVIGVLIFGLISSNLVFAATSMSHVMVLETNMQATGQSALIVAFTAGAADSGSIVLNMGTSTTAVTASQTIGTTYGGTDCETLTGATAHLPGTPASTGNTNPTITITGTTALSTGTEYCFVLGTIAAQTAVTNATAGQYTVSLTDGSDSGSVGTDVISNDQVTVSAVVPPAFTMGIQNTSDNFSGNLSSGSVSATSGDTITINTNASHGWYLYGTDASTGLHSATAGKTIASGNTTGSVAPGANTTLSAGAEGYVTGIPAANISQGTGSGLGTTSATAAFASSGSGNGAGLSSTAMYQIASSTGPANSTTVKPLEYASISGVTPAGTDYSDTLTFVGAGSF